MRADPERLGELHRVNIRAPKAFRKSEVTEIIGYARSGDATRTIDHVSTNPVSADAVQRTPPPPRHEAASAEIERETGRPPVRHVRHTVEIYRAPVEKFVVGSGVGIRIYEFEAAARKERPANDAGGFPQRVAHTPAPLVVVEGERLIRPVVVCVRRVIAIVAAIVECEGSGLPAVRPIQADVYFRANGSLIRHFTSRGQSDRRESRLESSAKGNIRPEADRFGGLSKARHHPTLETGPAA